MLLPFFLLLSQQFEVASVKPFKEPVIANTYRVSPNGDLRIVNMSLREMIRTAWELHESQLSGTGPVWLEPERWSVEGKVGDAAADPSAPMPAASPPALPRPAVNPPPPAPAA